MSGKLNEAEVIYDEILAISQSSSDLSHMSVVKTLLGDYENALLFAQKAVALNPDNAGWLLNLGDLLKLNGSTEQANTIYKKVILLNLNKDDLYTRSEYAQATAHLGNINEAIHEIESLKRDFPESGFVYFTAALVYVLIEEPNLALFHANESINLGFDKVWYSLPWFQKLCESDTSNTFNHSAVATDTCVH